MSMSNFGIQNNFSTAAKIIYLSLRAATPGKVFPSNNSKDAPPPVDTCETNDSVFHFAQHEAVSPPPIIVTQPLLVAATTLSMRPFVPLAKFGNSNTPGGPFQTINLARNTGAAKSSRDFGPISSPIQPAGMPCSTVALPTWKQSFV